MKSEIIFDSDFVTYEEEYKGYEIYIDKNADRYRGGFIWSVSKSFEELETDLNFTPESCLEDAWKFINELQKT